GDRDPLLLSRGQLAREVAGAVSQPHAAQQACTALNIASLAPANPRKEHVLHGGQIVDQTSALGGHPDVLPSPPGPPILVQVLEGNVPPTALARAGQYEAGRSAEQRGLP